MRAGGIDHLWIRVADVAASKRFYETVAPLHGFASLGHAGSRAVRRRERLVLGAARRRSRHGPHGVPGPRRRRGAGLPPAATGAGYADNGPPGERVVYHPGYYGAFVLDPDGHNIEVVNHNRGESD